MGANILAADPSRGWGSTIGQGLAGTIGTFDKFASEDMTTRQKAQDLASRIKKHAETLGESSYLRRQTIGETSRHNRSMEEYYRDRLNQESWKDIPYTTQRGDPVIRNFKTGETRNGLTHEPLPKDEKLTRVGGGSRGVGNSPQEIRFRLAQMVHPDDPKAAAALALGGREPTNLQIDAFLMKNFPELIGKSPEELAAYRESIRERAGYGQSPSARPAATPISPIDKAREAIAAGANREEVIKRLKEKGIDPSGL